MPHDSKVCTLADLAPGQRARIVQIDTSDLDIQRLMVLGLVEGATLEFRAAALGGDPLEFRLYGGTISMRRAHARHFQVSDIHGPA